MTYDIEVIRDLYGWDIYYFYTEAQKINVAFLHLEGKTHQIICFAEDGKPTVNPHEEKFMRTVDEIVNLFDNNRENIYVTYAE